MQICKLWVNILMQYQYEVNNIDQNAAVGFARIRIQESESLGADIFVGESFYSFECSHINLVLWCTLHIYADLSRLNSFLDACIAAGLYESHHWGYCDCV